MSGLHEGHDGERVDVVLDAEWLDDGSVRVHLRGVFRPEARNVPPPGGMTRNTCETWLGVQRDPSPIGVFNIDTRTKPK